MAEGWRTNRDNAAEKLRRDEIRLLEDLKEMVSNDKELNEDKFVQLQVEREKQENKRFTRWFSDKYETTDQDKILFEEIRNWFTTARSILDARFIRVQSRDVICEIVLYDEPRLTARVQSSMDKKLDNIKAEPLSNRDRTELLFRETRSSLTGMQYISDIYRINGSFNFTVPCCVSMQLKMKYNEKINDLKAVVRDNDKWTEIPATLENENAVFGLRSMDCVYVVTVPKATEADVTEDGYEYSSDADDRICLSVPAKAIDQPTAISIKILFPDGEVAKKVQKSRDKYNIVAISPCLCIEYKGSGMLKKRVTVTLPLIQPPNTRDYETILLALEENTVSRVKTTVRVGDRNAVSSEVLSPKNLLYALVKKTADVKLLHDEVLIGQESQMYALVKKTADVRLLHDEVLLSYGLAKYYKVLSFRDSKDLRALRTECTPLEKVQQVIDERKKEGYILERNGGQSNPLLLRQGQRLRMDITGNIEKDVSVPQVAYFITVLFGAHDQKTFFPYKIKGVIGGTYFGTLTISADNFKRGDLCSMHFDPQFVMSN